MSEYREYLSCGGHDCYPTNPCLPCRDAQGLSSKGYEKSIDGNPREIPAKGSVAWVLALDIDYEGQVIETIYLDKDAGLAALAKKGKPESGSYWRLDEYDLVTQ